MTWLTYICEVGIEPRYNIHIRLSHEACLVLWQVNEVPDTLLKVIHHRNLFGIK